MIQDSKTDSKNKSTVSLILFSFFMFAAVVIYVYRAGHGLGVFNDESFYLTIPYRMIRGNALFADEWHVSQLSALIQYLPLKLYVLIKGSTDGIILYWRYLYIAVQCLISFAVFLSFRRKYGIFAAAASLIYFLCVPFTIMSVSYNQIGIAFSFLTAVMLTGADKAKRPWLHLFITGLLYAVSVLGNPCLALIYFIYSAAVLVLRVMKKNMTISGRIKWLPLTCGICAAALPVILYLLIKTGIGPLAANFRGLFMDPEYKFNASDGSRANILTNSAGQHILPDTFFTNLPFAAFFIAGILCFIAYAADNKRLSHRKLYFISAVIVFNGIALTLLYLGNWTDISLTELPLALFGLFCFLLTKNKDKNHLLIWLFGLFTAACYYISSDTAFCAFNTAMVIAAAAAALMAGQLFGELKNEINANNNPTRAGRHILPLLLSLTVIIQTAIPAYYAAVPGRLVNMMPYDSPESGFTQELHSGPFKRIKTTVDMAEYYNETIKDLNYIKESYSGPLLIFGMLPYGYLYSDLDIGTFSSWVVIKDIDAGLARYKTYYALHPDKIPDVVYVTRSTNTTIFSAGEPIDVSVIQDLFSGKIVRSSSVGYVFEIDGYVGDN